MSRSIESMLPQYEARSRRIQMDIPLSLAQHTSRILKSRHLTWSELGRTLFQKFVEDVKPLAIEETVNERRLRLTREQIDQQQEEMFKKG